MNSYKIRFVDASGENEPVEITREYQADTTDVVSPNWTRAGYTITW